MAKGSVNENEKILVKVDQNNLIYIDPNSVVDKDGSIAPRGIKQEELVMYVNLEADLIPRTILIADENQSTLTSIAKGRFDFLAKQTNGDLDTTWTDAYLESKEKLRKDEKTGALVKMGSYASDETGQSFGIDNISIITKGINSIPEVTINFIDVRGKTLFESPENSPYNTFFHIPWPIFYLTLKGFYGKAIRYRLHLIKFSSRYNENSGNFEITTKFVGSTFAYLSDIPLKGILNAPYMFMVEKAVTRRTDGRITGKIISRSSKGYATLRGVYSEYKQKGLLPKDFPVKTLRELIIVAESLDKIFENQILGQRLNPQIFVGLKDFSDALSELEEQVNGWKTVNLKNEFITINPDTDNEVLYYYINNKENTQNYEFNILYGENKPGTFEFILTERMKDIKNSKLFADTILKDKTMGINFNRKTILAKQLKSFDTYILRRDGKYLVAMDILLADVAEIRKTFSEQKDKLELAVEAKMNEVLKNKTNKESFGFEPTIRNIFGVILANADTYIRLLRDTHRKAFEQSERRAKIIGKLSNETSGELAIFPWPEIKKPNKGEKSNVIAYPGERDLVSQLKSNNYNLWPEVDFVENFISVSTNREDTNTDKETGVGNINYQFENDNIDRNRVLNINTLFTTSDAIPYIDQTPASFIYEIWERAVQTTLLDSFDYAALSDLAGQEFLNIQEVIKENDDLIEILKKSGTTISNYLTLLNKISPYERSSYYRDFIPSVTYIRNFFDVSHRIKRYSILIASQQITPEGYGNLAKELIKYKPENYRLKIYPYNSSTYLDYLNQETFGINEFNFNKILVPDVYNGFISSPIKISDWAKPNFRKNIFSQKLTIDDMSINILNTPYFHNQLYSDFNKVGANGKYVGSAYLLLNSLPFYDLEDNITFSSTLGTIRMSSLFREISSTHYLPYHLMVKWGSIYHRYKKYITDGVDILDGCLNSSNVTKIVTGNTFFNNNQTGVNFTGFTASGQTITYSGQTDIGVHPYYDAIFHQVVNDFPHYSVSLGNTSYSGLVENNIIKVNYREVSNGLKYWTNFVDISKYEGYTGDTRYTFLPCDGFNQHIDRTLRIPDVLNRTNLITVNEDTFDSAYQAYFRIIWEDDYINSEFSGQTFPAHNEYNLSYQSGTTRTDDKKYSIYEDYRKIIDLIATFSPTILEDFERIFLEFASEKINDDSLIDEYQYIKYNKFQNLLKDIVSVPKEASDSTNIELLINQLKTKQIKKLEQITADILSASNVLQFTVGNPKEINSHVFQGFADLDNLNSFTYEDYDVSQLTTQNRKYIKLYIGEDIDLYYENFFSVMNVALNGDNVLQFRPLILIYAGYVKSGGTNTATAFKEYIKNNIFTTVEEGVQTGGFYERLRRYLNYLLPKFTKLKSPVVSSTLRKFSGYNDEDVKLELYNTFKSFNDKWIAGNSIGQRLLLEEFLFLDKANRDIGDKAFFNLDRLLDLGDPRNDKISLFGALSMILKGTGFDLRPLPAYVNFYGTNLNNKSKILPSEKVADNIFGTFLDVDYQESSPKVIIQFTGPSSKHPADMGPKNKFNDDSFFIGNTQNNPLIVTLPTVFQNADLYKSNRVVAFEVSFGDQNQSIFKGVELNQNSIRNTTESFVVLENMARSESGAGAYNVDIGLFDYYKQASYTCTVTMMGNVMIQPTMFFYLKNIPMFRGSYWITEVTQSIRNNNIVTTFTGTRIPYVSLPDPKDSFASTYRVLFERLMNKAITNIRNADEQTASSTITLQDKNGNTFVTDIGQEIDNEDVAKIIVKDVGISPFGLPYNGALGEKYIQLVKYNGKEWFRARVVKIGGVNYPLDDNAEFGLISKLNDVNKLQWSEIKETSSKKFFYTTKFRFSAENNVTPEKIITGKTKFLIPKSFQQTKKTYDLSYNVSGSYPTRVFTGQIGTGPNKEGYGIAMSEALMKRLNIIDGDIVYFQIT